MPEQTLTGWLWECGDCGHLFRADPPAGTDWPDGVLRACPATCPECEHPGDFVEE
jgi:hypothetical protein